MQRIADQYGVVSPPAIVVHDRKLPPYRIVRDQRVSVQNLPKNALAQRARLCVAHLRESGTHESGLIDLNNEGAEAGLIAVVMRVKISTLGFDESLGQGIERPGGAEPCEAIGQETCGRAEFLLGAAPYQ